MLGDKDNHAECDNRESDETRGVIQSLQTTVEDGKVAQYSYLQICRELIFLHKMVGMGASAKH
jgi:hypothetical protein